ncbi:MAG: hypothetical protein M1133_12730 [Armatimonadetes bacterium]|nr:hypothetical protein [Armatimonadota bacterium]
MRTIRAIETEYNGYKFRSRLEARWAVFFDTLDVPYEYEPEGFELGNGIRYLPDFWLPDQQCWVEIKRGLPMKQEKLKASALAAASGNPVFVFFGPIKAPDIDSPRNWALDSPATYAIKFYLDGRYSAPFIWCQCPACGRLSIEHLGQMGSRCCLDEDEDGLASDQLREAYLSARQARFEFGEQGTRDWGKPNGG